MSFFLKAKKLDIKTGTQSIILLNENEAWHYGIRAGDKVSLKYDKYKINAEANTSTLRVKRGEVGLYRDIWQKYKIKNDQIIELDFLDRPASIKAINKKLLGRQLNFQEYDAIIKDIVSNRLSNAQVAYFVASGFLHPYSDEEIYYLTKAVAENGEILKFQGIVADKHSIGGLAGNRTTMIVVPIVAALGIKIPKTSSRAITSPSGTADTMEVLAPVNFDVMKIRKIVAKTNGCLVWGGGLNLAPADDRIIKATYPMALEPYTKMLVSIMAKKVACGITHLVIDMPFGETTKVAKLKPALMIKSKFEYLAKRFGIKIKVVLTKGSDPVGRGVGPALEARDVLRVLQQKENKPVDLENKAMRLAGGLLELVGRASPGKGAALAWETLINGLAWKKMQQIIKEQGGNPNIDANNVTLGALKYYFNSPKSGKIIFTNNKEINDLCRILGAPSEKLAGIYFNKEIGALVKKGERLFTLYAQTKGRMDLALKALEKMRIFAIK